MNLWENTETDKDSGSFLIHLNEGTSRIKIVGKKAQGNAKLTLSDDFDGEIEAVSYTYPK